MYDTCRVFNVLCRFIKRLCNFFKPSGHLFSMIRFSEANQKKFSTVGKLLVKFLCCIEEVSCTHSIIHT